MMKLFKEKLLKSLDSLTDEDIKRIRDEYNSEGDYDIDTVNKSYKLGSYYFPSIKEKAAFLQSEVEELRADLDSNKLNIAGNHASEAYDWSQQIMEDLDKSLNNKKPNSKALNINEALQKIRNYTSKLENSTKENDYANSYLYASFIELTATELTEEFKKHAKEDTSNNEK